MKHVFHKKKKRLLIIYLTVLSLPVILGYALTAWYFYYIEAPFNLYELSSFFCLEVPDFVLYFSFLLVLISVPFALFYLYLLWKETRKKRFQDSLLASVFFCAFCCAVFFQNVSWEQLIHYIVYDNHPSYFLSNLNSANHAYSKGEYASANAFFRLAKENFPVEDDDRDIFTDFFLSKAEAAIKKGIRLSDLAAAEEAAASGDYETACSDYLHLIGYDPHIPILYERAADYSIAGENYLKAVEFLKDGYENTASDSLKQKQNDLTSRLYLASTLSYEPGTGDYAYQFFDEEGTLRETRTYKYKMQLIEQELFDENGEYISNRSYYDDGTLYHVAAYKNGHCTFSCYYDTSGNISEKSFRNYDEYGNLTSRRNYENTEDGEVLVSEHFWEYDRQQRIVRDEQFFFSDGTHTAELSGYDAEGNLCSSETSTYVNDVLISQEWDLYTHDAEGNITSLHTYRDGKLSYSSHKIYEYHKNGIPASCTYYNNDSGYIYTTHEEYDKNGNTTLSFYSSPDLDTKSFYEYDHNHTLRKSISYYNGWLDQVITYDANGNCLSRISYTEDGPVCFQEFSTYNENGDILISTSFDVVTDTTTRKEATICQYDDNGNLTEKIFYRDGETTITDYEYDVLGSLTQKTISYGNRENREVTCCKNDYELRH